MSRFDLHSHTTASDGALSPRALVERARRLGITTLAVTDHDTVEALPEARAAGAALSVEILSGIEISATRAGGGALHVLGYLFEESHPVLLESLKRLRNGRSIRNAKIAERLTKLGMPVELEEVERRARGTVGRPHFAEVLIERGYVKSMDEAFERWLADGRPAWVDKEVLSPEEAIGCIRAAGGIASLAHPFAYETDPAALEKLIASLARLGLGALEVHYGPYSPGERVMLACFADRYGLVPTGGSDFHREPGVACPPMPPDVLERLRERRQR